MKKQTVARNTGIDAVKALAILGVIVIHVCSPGYSYPVLSFDWLSTVFWGSLVRASVPLFFMCSGALLLDPDKDLTIGRLYKKNVLRIVAALFVWALVYKAYHLAAAGTYSGQDIVHALKEVLLFKHEFHFYYLHIILLVYAFLPVTRLFVRRAEKKDMQYALLLWFVLGILYPTLRPFWPFSLLGGIPAQWLMNMTYAAIGYGLLGYYLTRYPLMPGRSLLSAAAGFLTVFILTVVMSVRNGSLYEGFMEGMTVGPALLATGIFGLCANRKSRIGGRLAGAVTRLSKASFCIYLVHVLFIYLLGHFRLTATGFPCLVSIPLISCVILALSYLVFLILSKIPVVNRWLI